MWSAIPPGVRPWWRASGVLAVLLTLGILGLAAVAGHRSWHDYHAPVEEVPEGMTIVFGAVLVVVLVPVGVVALAGAVLTWRGRASGLVVTAVLAGLGLASAVAQLGTTIALETQGRSSPAPAAQGNSTLWTAVPYLVAAAPLLVAMVVPILALRRTPQQGRLGAPPTPPSPSSIRRDG